MTLEPFKIVGQLIACEKDENDDVVGERVVAEMVLYAPQFGELQQRVANAWPDIAAAHAAQAPAPPAHAPAIDPSRPEDGRPGLVKARRS